MIRRDVAEEARPRAVLRVAGRELRLCIDGDARPTQMLLEVVGRAEVAPVTGADAEEEAVAPISEEVADDQLFVEL